MCERVVTMLILMPMQNNKTTITAYTHTQYPHHSLAKKIQANTYIHTYTLYPY